MKCSKCLKVLSGTTDTFGSVHWPVCQECYWLQDEETADFLDFIAQGGLITHAFRGPYTVDNDGVRSYTGVPIP